MMEREQPEQSQVLSAINSENPKEINTPLNEPIEIKEECQNKKEVNKTGMCQIIYYDFSLK